MASRDVPLCVDLDGTLVRSDLLVESALNVLAKNPLYLFLFVFWFLKGKANLKRRIAEIAVIDVTTLPYDKRLFDWLRQQAAERDIVLCTASDQRLAEAVAAHLGGFSAVLGSDGIRNLAGKKKVELLRERYDDGGFDYVGNTWVDLFVWRYARRAILANAPPRLVRRVERMQILDKVFEREHRPLHSWIRALRLHQWIKNVLVFLPLLAAHRLFAPYSFLSGVFAFLSFGLCASGTYILNDLLDLSADRRHVRKRNRPFASGALPISLGISVAMLLLVASFSIAWMLSLRFTSVLLVYVALTLGYSFRLKRIVMLDVVVLAALYTIRIIAGTVAIRVEYSFWLLAFSMFIFLSLAMLKRYTELQGLLESGQQMAGGRGYAVDDLPLIQSLGAASGYLSVLVLALYINSTASEVLYRHPHVLWLLCPLLLYWISRIWVVAHRGLMHDDPIVFAVTDRVSGFSLLLGILVVLGAI